MQPEHKTPTTNQIMQRVITTLWVYFCANSPCSLGAPKALRYCVYSRNKASGNCSYIWMRVPSLFLAPRLPLILSSMANHRVMIQAWTPIYSKTPLNRPTKDCLYMVHLGRWSDYDYKEVYGGGSLSRHPYVVTYSIGDPFTSCDLWHHYRPTLPVAWILSVPHWHLLY